LSEVTWLRAERQGFHSQQGGRNLFTASTAILEPAESPTQWVTGAISPELSRPDREVDQLPPSGARCQECVELYLHSPAKAWCLVKKLMRLHGVVLS